jgi:(1->4)-alpha-D-glucan 1-alpha-D-glucosylmutase
VLGDPTAGAALRFQQTSGMVMAKGVEDCAFYRASRLTSLNEVGGDPSVFAMSPPDFHQAMAERQEHWPDATTASTTHDTKRSEDVRARISVLAEVPDRWRIAVDELLELVPVPDPGFGNLMWQAVVGAWPASRERLHAYAEKAMREAGDHTAWTDVDESYESAVHAAVDAVFDDATVRRIVDELVADIAEAGWSNALAAKLLTLTVPGVPDVYQGSETWEQSLVDPDNRRPVDFAARSKLLGSLQEGGVPSAPSTIDDDGAAKLLLTHAALTTRRDRPELFAAYHPVLPTGAAADHLVAFDRGGAVTMVTRLPVGLARRGGWGDTTLPLPDGTWTDVLTGRRHTGGEVSVEQLLQAGPVALLVQDQT